MQTMQNPKKGMQISKDFIQLDSQVVSQCFKHLHDPHSSPQTRKQADKYLLEMQNDFIELMGVLLVIFQNNFSNPQNMSFGFQALIYFGNVVKRQWNIKRRGSIQKQFEFCKKVIKDKLIDYIQCGLKKENMFTHTLFNVLSFICEAEYPHNYSKFTVLIGKTMDAAAMSKNTVVYFKEIKDIFLRVCSKRGHTTKKQFDQELRPLIYKFATVGQKLRDVICKNGEIPDANAVKISKYIDQILISILMLAPLDLYDDDFINCLKYASIKLQTLLKTHLNETSPLKQRILLQKNIKSLIFSFGTLQQANPLSIAPIMDQYYQILTFCISNYGNFQKSTILRYSLLGLRKLIRQFSYYSQDKIFFSSLGNKPKCEKYLDLRKICSQSYYKNLSNQNLEGIMNILITKIIGVRYKDEHQATYDFQQNVSFEKDINSQKQLSTQICSLVLMETILQRFFDFSFANLKNLIAYCNQNKWSINNNMSQDILLNLFAVLAILPKSIKQNRVAELYEIPILDILNVIHTNHRLAIRFPVIVSGWVEAFTDEQINSLINVLLEFIQKQYKVEILMQSAQALNKIVSLKFQVIDLGNIIKLLFPVAINMFNKFDNPDVLWPMVNLISNVITKTEFNTEIIVNSMKNQSFQTLFMSESVVLVDSLSEMFRNFLCIIPRDSPAQCIFYLVGTFLNKHLENLFQSYFDKVLNLWYIAIRQYSSKQECDYLYIEIFNNHYKKVLRIKSPTTLYILEEYMLLDLMDGQLKDYVEILQKFYTDLQTLQKQEGENLKIATLSFYITLITKYGLSKVNTETMLKAILNNFIYFQQGKISAALRNSLLSIVNRYLILYKNQFFTFLGKIGMNSDIFIDAYFKNMLYLTSRTAMKINAIALISLLTYLDSKTIGERFQQMMVFVIPQVQNYITVRENSSMQGYMSTNNVGKIQNSPTLRFASNILSVRKEEIRKQSGFDDIDLPKYFVAEVQKLATNMNVPIQNILNLIQGSDWQGRIVKYFC